MIYACLADHFLHATNTGYMRNTLRGQTGIYFMLCSNCIFPQVAITLRGPASISSLCQDAKLFCRMQPYPPVYNGTT